MANFSEAGTWKRGWIITSASDFVSFAAFCVYPEKGEQKETKVTKIWDRRGIWELKIPWDLGLGIWNFSAEGKWPNEPTAVVADAAWPIPSLRGRDRRRSRSRARG